MKAPKLLHFRAAALTSLVAAHALAAPPQPEWTLFAPTNSTTTYLIDLDGVVQHQWPSAYRPGNAVYLLDAGELLRTGTDTSVAGFQAGGRRGRLQRIGWDGTLQWDYQIADANRRQHHDAILLPNGNVLAIVWEKKTVAQAVAAGRNPATLSQGELWSEALLEIQPVGATGGTIVWEWHAWDHLVQNFDAAKPNFAPPSSRPERININYPANTNTADWLHMNGLAYNESLDQVVVSSHNFNEVWIISHAPGANGDLLYRWGNPAAYATGTTTDQKLFGQHNPQWIAEGLEGAGHVLVYNNGLNRPQGAYSSVEEIVPPLAEDGAYTRSPGQAFGPAASILVCNSADGAQFYSSNISGAQRLSNGNTLVCVGSSGRFIELDASCRIVWEYTDPFGGANPAAFRATRIDARDNRLRDLLWCAADFNGDNMVDDGDFVVFLAAYNLLLCDDPAMPAECPADLNADGFVDDADFVVFIGAYDTLLCP
ncbi:MAG: aryl-sulfate sulfotransferase [Phycisphaeraceae bacterium]|nr:aryl-sulfate sulfotransferase [Phycisphaeraceae bacterium]